MRRILAALAAVAMVAAGFLVRRSLDDPERGKAPLRIACVVEATDACNSIERATITVLSPAEIENKLKNAAGDPPFDAVVTASPWPERLKVSAQAATPTSDEPLVSSPIVVARRSIVPDPCASKLNCLVALDRRVLFPDVRTTTAGAIIAAVTMAGGGVEEADVRAEAESAETLVGQLSKATSSTISSDPITTLTAGGALIDAIVEVNAVLPKDAAGLVITAAVPSASVQLRLLGYVPDERLTSTAAKLRAALVAQGWSAEVADDVPAVGLMSATYDRLK